MPLSYIDLPPNDFGLVKALPLHEKWFPENYYHMASRFTSYAPVADVVIDLTEGPSVAITPLGNNQTDFQLTRYGFIVSKNAWFDTGDEEYLEQQPVLAVTGGDFAAAQALVQHAALVQAKQSMELPYFVRRKDNSLAVDHLSVERLMQTTSVETGQLPRGRGVRFSCVLPDGFVLAEHGAAAMLAVNNDFDIAQQMGEKAVKDKATEKLWELLGWQMRQWLCDQTHRKLGEVFADLPSHSTQGAIHEQAPGSS